MKDIDYMMDDDKCCNLRNAFIDKNGDDPYDAWDAGWRAACEVWHARAQAKAGPSHPMHNQKDTSGNLPFVMFKDGTQWCATRLDFRNPQESLAGFGPSVGEAMCDLVLAEHTHNHNEAARDT